MVSEANITERRKRGVPVGENMWYGMGLFDRVAWGVPVVTHGGTLQGYHSNFYALPDAGIGAVILTNADPGAAMLGPFLRRLMEVVYDGRPEAAADIAAAAARQQTQAAARKARLTLPGDPAVIAGVASRYRSPEGLIVSISQKKRPAVAEGGLHRRAVRDAQECRWQRPRSSRRGRGWWVLTRKWGPRTACGR